MYVCMYVLMYVCTYVRKKISLEICGLRNIKKKRDVDVGGREVVWTQRHCDLLYGILARLARGSWTGPVAEGQE